VGAVELDSFFAASLPVFHPLGHISHQAEYECDKSVRDCFFLFFRAHTHVCVFFVGGLWVVARCPKNKKMAEEFANPGEGGGVQPLGLSFSFIFSRM